jgi:hypothetical protein
MAKPGRGGQLAAGPAATAAADSDKAVHKAKRKERVGTAILQTKLKD